MPDPSTQETHEGPVRVGAAPEPTVVPPETEDENPVAYSSPFMEQLAKKAAKEQAKSEKVTTDFQVGTWSGLPNFGCPLCSYTTLKGDVAILAHGVGAHPGKDLKEALPNG